MRVISLDHVNIHTARVAETIRFYVDGLGLTCAATGPGGLKAPDPNAPDVKGAWLCDASGRAIFHVIRDVVDAKATQAPIDHVALDCDDRDGFIARLEERSLSFEVADFPQFGIRQLIVYDPNGIKIELGFRAASP